jgi:hypothetical protein
MQIWFDQQPGNLIDNYYIMEKNLPAVVVVPGFWCSATGIYDQLTTKLQERVSRLQSQNIAALDMFR